MCYSWSLPELCYSRQVPPLSLACTASLHAATCLCIVISWSFNMLSDVAAPATAISRASTCWWASLCSFCLHWTQNNVMFPQNTHKPSFWLFELGLQPINYWAHCTVHLHKDNNIRSVFYPFSPPLWSNVNKCYVFSDPHKATIVMLGSFTNTTILSLRI